MAEGLWGPLETIEIDVVGAVDEDNMDTTHAEEKRDDGQGHGAVLDKQTLRTNVAASYSQEDDGEAENGDPPANKQGRLDLCECEHGRRCGMETHGCCGKYESLEAVGEVAVG